MNTKTFPSITYGCDLVWRKIATMSAYTFDAEDIEVLDHWNKAHPKTFFKTKSVEPTGDKGVFHVWLPLVSDNMNWKPKEDRFRTEKMPKVCPTVYDHNVVKHWLNFAHPFLTEVFI